MRKLKYLDIGDIFIDGLPEWIHELTNLEFLFVFSGVGSNPYLKLPKTFT
jgi:hypothetical protein